VSWCDNISYEAGIISTCCCRGLVGLGFPLEDLTARMTELIQRDNVVLDGYIQTLHYMTALLRLLVRHGAH
jgi:hypothetical protein